MKDRTPLTGKLLNLPLLLYSDFRQVGSKILKTLHPEKNSNLVVNVLITNNESQSTQQRNWIHVQTVNVRRAERARASRSDAPAHALPLIAVRALAGLIFRLVWFCSAAINNV